MKKIIFALLFPSVLLAQNERVDVDYLSLITTPIYLYNGDSSVSQGTGFLFYKKDTVLKRDLVYLVTNYHVLTGAAPNENQQSIGDNIFFQIHKDPQNPQLIKEVRYPLYTTKGVPVFKKSEKYPEADIAIIPLPEWVIKGCIISAITEEWSSSPIKVRPSTSLTLIGYPYGYYDTANVLPIWKTGTIASEPNINFNNKPLFVVDISAFPGMSGSPAFVVANGSYETDFVKVHAGNARKFMGIYASMQMLEDKKYLEELDANNKKKGVRVNESLELGNIWKASLIIDIINNIDMLKYDKEINPQNWYRYYPTNN